METLAAQLVNKTVAMETQQERQQNDTETLRIQVGSQMASMKEEFKDSLRVSYSDLLARVENVSEVQELCCQVGCFTGS